MPEVVQLLPSNYGTRILNGDYAERAGSTPLRVEFHTPAQRFSASTVPKSLMVRWRDLSATRSDPAVSAESVSLSAFRRCRAFGMCRSLDSLLGMSGGRNTPLTTADGSARVDIPDVIRRTMCVFGA